VPACRRKDILSFVISGFSEIKFIGGFADYSI
jgi:hypothetical protein